MSTPSPSFLHAWLSAMDEEFSTASRHTAGHTAAGEPRRVASFPSYFMWAGMAAAPSSRPRGPEKPIAVCSCKRVDALQPLTMSLSGPKTMWSPQMAMPMPRLPLTPSVSGSAMMAPPPVGSAAAVEGAMERSVAGARKPCPVPLAVDITPPASDIQGPPSSYTTGGGPSSGGGLSSGALSDFQTNSASGLDEPQTTVRPRHREAVLSVGPRSMPVSRASSSSRPASQLFSSPLAPSTNSSDPYSAGRRAPQDPELIDARFVFARRKKRRSPLSSYSSGLSLSSVRSSASARGDGPGRRPGFLGLAGMFKAGKMERHESPPSSAPSRQSSLCEIKRFFRTAVGGEKSAGGRCPPTPAGSKPSSRDGNMSPSASSKQAPCGNDRRLSCKWGHAGTVLGSGAGGSVRQLTRSRDGATFAVKEFRNRRANENERVYVKKLTAEFCVGSALHHGSVIETLDILNEKGRWYEVMEYAPYDLFAIVMTGKMSRPEIACCWLQILSGITYLHSLGVAHRDLKLDNVVVSEHGIMKLVDFGSAHVFQYAMETASVPATGIVGSDPYLAPEVYNQKRYDAAKTDIWSLAIIYCCMSLQRFPWKLPRMTDNSFRLFAAQPSAAHDPEVLLQADTSTDDERQPGEASVISEEGGEADGVASETETEGVAGAAAAPDEARADDKGGGAGIRGPWRLLRLLPPESRRLVHRMLQTDPEKRAGMTEILEESWIANASFCHEPEPGTIFKADDHAHILVPPSPAPKR